MLRGKKILLGVTGSIAAYKAASIVRLLVREGCRVKVVMTEDAKDFITPLTLGTLSKNEVYSHFGNKDTGTWHNHVELGLWADLFLIAPATANTLAKAATGMADSLLVATYLSARCPVAFAPAMDLDMYAHPATKANLKTLVQRGNYIIDAEEGELASGLNGKGRLAEPESILFWLKDYFEDEQQLAGLKVLITAGPTFEPLDPVRFIGNHSSGRMGYALADEAARRGAKVCLISGPTELSPGNSGIELTRVTTAQEMYETAEAEFDKSDIVIWSAAVADYTPEITEEHKIKRKAGEELVVRLIPTKDISAELGQKRHEHQTLVGFALETNDAVENATGKLHRKNLDMIVLNKANEEGAGFRLETNKVTIIDKHNNLANYELKSKTEVAKDIFDYVLQLRYAPHVDAQN